MNHCLQRPAIRLHFDYETRSSLPAEIGYGRFSRLFVSAYITQFYPLKLRESTLLFPLPDR